ncbi:DUF6318 family protein [Arthrobacter sp. HLT1-20]
MRDCHTTRNSSSICTKIGRLQGLSPAVRAAPSPDGRTRLWWACRFSRQYLVAAAVSALLVLSGCSPSPPGTGATTPPGSGSASSGIPTPAATTPAPTTVAAYQPATAQGPAQNVPVPVLPEKAKEFSKEGLIAFTEYWYETLGYAFETGDPAPMMAISDPGCRTCEAMKKSVIAGHSGGKWIVGGKMVIGTPASSFAQTAEGNYQAITMARQEQVKFFKADKTLSKDLGVTIAEGDILVGVRQDGRWVATTVEHLDGNKGS